MALSQRSNDVIPSACDEIPYGIGEGVEDMLIGLPTFIAFLGVRDLEASQLVCDSGLERIYNAATRPRPDLRSAAITAGGLVMLRLRPRVLGIRSHRCSSTGA